MKTFLLLLTLAFSLQPSAFSQPWAGFPLRNAPAPASGGIPPMDTTNLVAYYKFDEGTTGATILDSSGNGNNATPTGSPVYVTGKVGPYALSFNATSQYATTTTENGVNIQDNTAWTISCWIQETGSSLEVIASTWFYPSVSGWFIDCNNNNAGDFSVGWKNAAGTSWRQAVSPGGLVNDGAWHFCVATYSGNGDVSGITLYVDGTSQSFDNTVNTAPGTLNSTTMGIAYLQGTSPLMFGGAMDDLRIYSVAKSAAAIHFTYTNNLAGHP